MTTRGTRRIVLLFTFAAGSVDAIAYLSAHVFTANMTGNAVLMGIYLGQGRGAAAANSLVAMIVFIAGIVLGAMLAGQAGGKDTTLAAGRREGVGETPVLDRFGPRFFLPVPAVRETVPRLWF